MEGGQGFSVQMQNLVCVWQWGMVKRYKTLLRERSDIIAHEHNGKRMCVLLCFGMGNILKHIESIKHERSSLNKMFSVSNMNKIQYVPASKNI